MLPGGQSETEFRYVAFHTSSLPRVSCPCPCPEHDPSSHHRTHSSRSLCNANGGQRDRGYIPSRPLQLHSQIQSHLDKSLHARFKSQCSKFCEEQYYPPATAAFADSTLDAHGLFERFQLRLCCSTYPSHGRAFDDDEYPVLFLTPGFQESRLDFSVFAQYLSSYGYKVILMEQRGEPNIVEFPDGEIVRHLRGQHHGCG